MNPLFRTVFRFGSARAVTRMISVLSLFNAGNRETVARRLQNRRAFTRNAVLGGSLISAGLLGGSFVTLLWPNKTGAFGGKINIGKANIPEVGGKPFTMQEGKFYITRNEDGLQAQYWKCVHLGCTVPYVEANHQFICPCHGSVYDLDGAKLAGPANRRMDHMPIEVNADGSISVDTNPSSLIVDVRNEYDKADATPYP